MKIVSKLFNNIFENKNIRASSSSSSFFTTSGARRRDGYTHLHEDKMPNKSSVQNLPVEFYRRRRNIHTGTGTGMVSSVDTLKRRMGTQSGHHHRRRKTRWKNPAQSSILRVLRRVVVIIIVSASWSSSSSFLFPMIFVQNQLCRSSSSHLPSPNHHPHHHSRHHRY